jgi:hypothetical protein
MSARVNELVMRRDHPLASEDEEEKEASDKKGGAADNNNKADEKSAEQAKQKAAQMELRVKARADAAAALQELQKIADETGHESAVLAVAVSYLHGAGCQRSVESAMKWISRLLVQPNATPAAADAASGSAAPAEPSKPAPQVPGATPLPHPLALLMYGSLVGSVCDSSFFPLLFVNSHYTVYFLRTGPWVFET